MAPNALAISHSFVLGEMELVKGLFLWHEAGNQPDKATICVTSETEGVEVNLLRMRES